MMMGMGTLISTHLHKKILRKNNFSFVFIFTLTNKYRKIYNCSELGHTKFVMNFTQKHVLNVALPAHTSVSFHLSINM
jgi:hypothetical protein